MEGKLLVTWGDGRNRKSFEMRRFYKKMWVFWRTVGQSKLFIHFVNIPTYLDNSQKKISNDVILLQVVHCAGSNSANSNSKKSQKEHHIAMVGLFLWIKPVATKVQLFWVHWQTDLFGFILVFLLVDILKKKQFTSQIPGHIAICFEITTMQRTFW